MSHITITGINALTAATNLDLTLGKHADPVDGAREGLTVAEAREISMEDPTLIYVRIPLVLGDLDRAEGTIAAEVAGVETTWSIVRHADGRPGWTAAGDDPSHWIDGTIAERLGVDLAIAIGSEIVARVR